MLAESKMSMTMSFISKGRWLQVLSCAAAPRMVAAMSFTSSLAKCDKHIVESLVTIACATWSLVEITYDAK